MSVSLFETKDPVLITAYGGKYHCIESDSQQVVIHTPCVGNSPGGLLEPKKRFFWVDGTHLFLETDWILDQNSKFKYRLKWEKTP